MLMDALNILKTQLGITTNARDEYLNAILNGVQSELQEIQGLVIDMTNPTHLMFIVDYAAWRYTSKGEDGGMPQRLHWRLRNLMVANNENI